MELSVQGLEYVYNPGTPLEIKALTGISFTLPSGKFLGIIGGTGSGKTTLVKNLNGLLTPTSGIVRLNGKDFRSYGRELRQKVGLVLQRPERQLFEETIFKDISFVLRRRGRFSETEINEKVRRAAETIGLNIDEIGHRSPLELTEGQKRKAAIAAILVNDPEILILDEPVVGLDPPAVADLVKALSNMKASAGKTVILVSHDLGPFLPLLDLAMVLDKGLVRAYGAPEEVFNDIGQDPELKDHLPPLVLLIQNLRKAGFKLPPNEFRVDVLVRELSRAAHGMSPTEPQKELLNT